MTSQLLSSNLSDLTPNSTQPHSTGNPEKPSGLNNLRQKDHKGSMRSPSLVAQVRPPPFSRGIFFNKMILFSYKSSTPLPLLPCPTLKSGHRQPFSSFLSIGLNLFTPSHLMGPPAFSYKSRVQAILVLFNRIVRDWMHLL